MNLYIAMYNIRQATCVKVLVKVVHLLMFHIHSFAYITDRFLFWSLKPRGTRREIHVHNKARKVSLERRNFALSSGIESNSHIGFDPDYEVINKTGPGTPINRMA